MVTKKDLIIAILGTFCLTSTLFMIIPIRSPASNGVYDPWTDLNDDGVIDSTDLGLLGANWGTVGEPLNKTAKLLELQSRVDSLDASLLALEAYLNTKINSLNATFQSKIDSLNSTLATKLNAEPDWDSKWSTLQKNGYTTFPHNLGTTKVLVYMIGKDVTGTCDIHQMNYGGEDNGWNYFDGAYWVNLTESEIKVFRYEDDLEWDQVRIMIWKIPES